MNMEEIQADFEERGSMVFEELRKTDPEAYIELIWQIAEDLWTD